MGNMARERPSCAILAIYLFLAFDLLALSVQLAEAAAAADDEIALSRYEYYTPNGISHLEQQLEFELESRPGLLRTLDRRRRWVSQPDPESAGASKSEHQEASPSPPPAQPPMTSKLNGSTSVAYSMSEQSETVTGSVAVATTSKPGVRGAAAEQPAASVPTEGKPAVIVSTPIVPPANNASAKNASSSSNPNNASLSAAGIDKPAVRVWANQTMWPNVTEAKQKGKEEQPAEPSEQEDFSIDKYPAELTNKTLHDKNITKTETDTHQFYNSTFSTDEAIGKRYWVELANHPDVQTNTVLSESHRRAATIKLKFDFPFYGHKVRNITIATGGFLYTGEYVHSWLAATQYIAPLMANFDTTLSQKSFVKYLDNGTAFTVEWQNVHLQDKPEAGAFTFQVTLMQNGDIVFVYSKIPVLVENIEDTEHPVKIGLSDAYMMDRTVFFARRKTIYEYHRVNFNKQDIKNWTAIYLKALPTCLQMDNCHDCLTKIKEFDCKWCPELQKCSTGTFRFRQDWLQKGCDVRNVRDAERCPAARYPAERPGGSVDTRAEDRRVDDLPLTKYIPNQAVAASSTLEEAQDNMNMGVSGIVSILLVVSLVAGLAAWAAYAYRNPHTASGQMLIRYRPSQWTWRRGEARYTAATIHM